MAVEWSLIIIFASGFLLWFGLRRIVIGNWWAWFSAFLVCFCTVSSALAEDTYLSVCYYHAWPNANTSGGVSMLYYSLDGSNYIQLNPVSPIPISGEIWVARPSPTNPYEPDMASRVKLTVSGNTVSISPVGSSALVHGTYGSSSFSFSRISISVNNGSGYTIHGDYSRGYSLVLASYARYVDSSFAGYVWAISPFQTSNYQTPYGEAISSAYSDVVNICLSSLGSGTGSPSGPGSGSGSGSTTQPVYAQEEMDIPHSGDTFDQQFFVDWIRNFDPFVYSRFHALANASYSDQFSGVLDAVLPEAGISDDFRQFFGFFTDLRDLNYSYANSPGDAARVAQDWMGAVFPDHVGTIFHAVLDQADNYFSLLRQNPVVAFVLSIIWWICFGIITYILVIRTISTGMYHFGVRS